MLFNENQPLLELFNLAIRDHAFLTSEYPLILSIEDHCTLPQVNIFEYMALVKLQDFYILIFSVVKQRKMAQKFQEIFGELLVTQFLDKNETQLPSPEQLKRRIILKHKKLPENGNVEEVVPSSSSIRQPEDFSKDIDLSNTIKNGVMYLKDDIGLDWIPHFFVLTVNQLSYTEMTSDEDINDDTASIEEASDQDDPANSSKKQLEIHFSEKWFHGRLRGGRTAANELVEKYAIDFGDGTFLVRESDNFVGDYTISFW